MRGTAPTANTRQPGTPHTDSGSAPANHPARTQSHQSATNRKLTCGSRSRARPYAGMSEANVKMVPPKRENLSGWSGTGSNCRPSAFQKVCRLLLTIPKMDNQPSSPAFPLVKDAKFSDKAMLLRVPPYAGECRFVRVTSVLILARASGLCSSCVGAKAPDRTARGISAPHPARAKTSARHPADRAPDLPPGTGRPRPAGGSLSQRGAPTDPPTPDRADADALEVPPRAPGAAPSPQHPGPPSRPGWPGPGGRPMSTEVS
jgi:hypothetical protein